MQCLLLDNLCVACQCIVVACPTQRQTRACRGVALIGAPTCSGRSAPTIYDHQQRANSPYIVPGPVVLRCQGKRPSRIADVLQGPPPPTLDKQLPCAATAGIPPCKRRCGVAAAGAPAKPKAKGSANRARRAAPRASFANTDVCSARGETTICAGNVHSATVNYLCLVAHTPAYIYIYMGSRRRWGVATYLARRRLTGNGSLTNATAVAKCVGRATFDRG